MFKTYLVIYLELVAARRKRSWLLDFMVGSLINRGSGIGKSANWSKLTFLQSLLNAIELAKVVGAWVAHSAVRLREFLCWVTWFSHKFFRIIRKLRFINNNLAVLVFNNKFLVFKSSSFFFIISVQACWVLVQMTDLTDGLDDSSRLNSDIAILRERIKKKLVCWHFYQLLVYKLVIIYLKFATDKAGRMMSFLLLLLPERPSGRRSERPLASTASEGPP